MVLSKKKKALEPELFGTNAFDLERNPESDEEPSAQPEVPKKRAQKRLLVSLYRSISKLISYSAIRTEGE